MLNHAIASQFERMADLLEIDGKEGFRINSFRRAARAIDGLAVDVADLANQNRLTEIDGIGKGTAERIVEYMKTGKMAELVKLEEKFPLELPKLLDIPGLGPKKIAVIHKQLGVGGLADLKRVIESGELAQLKSFGAASVKKIAEGIAFLESSSERTPLGVAAPLAEAFLGLVRELPGVRRAELAGSLRRGMETIGDVDIVCDADDGPAVVKAFTELGGVRRVLAAGGTKGSVTVGLERNRELQIDLRVVPAESFGAAWQYFTGSKEHNVRLREMAVRRKWRLNEYGLHDGETMLAGKEEEEIYRKLDLPWFPPELREDRGEFEWKPEELPLIELGDIRGDLHMHTTASDGRHSIEQMAEAAKERGYGYIAICDHSKSSVIANGLSIERMWQQIEDVRAANRRLKGITVLAGCECDICADGTLDYPDELLRECDWVVASIHSGMGSGEGRKMGPTERTIAAMENPYVGAIGHATGRLINRRPPMQIEMGKVIEAAARTGTMLEINASWQRLDLKDVHARQAREAGVMLVINTDAHSITQLDQMRFGVITARRAGARKVDVANALPLDELRGRIAAKRGK